MKNEPSKTVTDAWISLFTAHSALLEQVQNALKKNDCPPLPWYDILWELEKAGPGGVRPYELESLILFKAQYSISRLISRIESAGYLKKMPCAEDGRGYSVVITASGIKARKVMWSVYSVAINESFGDKLSEKEYVTLHKALSKLYG